LQSVYHSMMDNCIADINEDFSSIALPRFCLHSVLSLACSIPASFPSTLLTLLLQACPYTLSHPPDTCDGRPPSCICALLQTLSAVHSNTYICHSTRHITWPYAHTRPIHFDAIGFYHYPAIRTLRSIILLLTINISKERRQYPPTTSNQRRNCFLLFPCSSSEIFTTPCTSTRPELSAS
jgi:hypothetical protein